MSMSIFFTHTLLKSLEVEDVTTLFKSLQYTLILPQKMTENLSLPIAT